MPAAPAAGVQALGGFVATCFVKPAPAGAALCLCLTAARLAVTLTSSTPAGRAFIASNFGPRLAAGPRHTIISGLSKPRDWKKDGVEYQAALPKRLAGFLGLVYHRGWLRFAGEPLLAAATYVVNRRPLPGVGATFGTIVLLR